MAETAAEMVESAPNDLDITQPSVNGDANGHVEDSMETTAMEIDESTHQDSDQAKNEPEEEQMNVNDENEKNEVPEGGEANEAMSSSLRRSSRVKTPAVKTPVVTPRTASNKKKAERTDEEKDTDDIQPTPKRRASSRVKVPAQKLETPEVGNVKRTPAPDRKRQAESENRNTKVAKQQRLSDTPVIANKEIEKTDPTDPFSFDSNADQHPEPLKNIQMEKGAFGEVKFTTTPIPPASKYANTEKAASERRGNLFSSSLSEGRTSLLSDDRKPDKISMLSPIVRREFEPPAPSSTVKKTPSTSKTPRNKRARSKDSSRVSEGTFDMDTTQEDRKPTPKTARRKSTPTPAVLPPVKQEEAVVAPQLTPGQQIEVDHPQTNAPLMNGARVFAKWGNDYYPAIVCGRDGLSRYTVVFTEDNAHNNVPPTGVIAISKLPIGQKVSNVEENEEYQVRIGELLSLPSHDDPEIWAEGLFEIHLENGDVEKISWEKLYITKDQAADLIKQMKNNAVVVSSENIVIEEGKRRSSARNRSLDANQFDIKTPVSSAKRTPQAKSTKRTPKNIDDHVEDKQKTPKEKFATPKLPVKDSASSEPIQEVKPTAIVTPSRAKTIEAPKQVPVAPPSLKIFENMLFVLTSANRPRFPDQPVFNKRECRMLIEERGGIVIDDFKDLHEGAQAFLIADTFYRTQKYLSALSLSIPCVDHKWISECNEMIDYKDFMLAAGESTITEAVCNWKPLKGILLDGKKVCVYSKTTYDDKRILGFVSIWTPIIQNLGATLVEMPDSSEDRNELISGGNIDILLTDPACEPELVSAVEDRGGIVVSSEWSIISGQALDVSASERFRYDVV